MADVLDLDAGISGDTDNPSVTVSAGSKRVLMVVITNEGAATVSVTWGGQAMTQLLIETIGTSMTIQLFYLMEAGIAAASGTTLAITGEAGTFIWHAQSFENVAQFDEATTFPTTASAQTTSSTPNPVVADIVMDGATENVVYAGSGQGNSDPASWDGDAGMAEDTSEVSGTHRSSTASSVVPVDTVLCRCTWTNQNRAATVACEINSEDNDVVGGEEFLGRQYPQGVMRGVMRGAA